ncbi:MAG: hypothetical protein QOJ62_598, partial [Actinomycetota bacterium]|nr:hypothetical protein [Actinomycetota bacterium]
FEFFCYVDSVRGVDELGDRLDAGWTAGSRPLAVLVEVGVEGGRTGARDASQVHDVATAVGRHPSLALVGVAGYEGPFGHDSDAATVAAVRGFVVSLADTLRDLDAKGLLDDAAREFILTCGGSGHVDAVTSVLAEPANCSRPVRAVLRSGAYVTHDDGLYAQTSSIAPQLQPAIEVWCQVLSRPEPGLALLGAGRRDLPFDSGMPIAKWRWATSSGSVTRLRAEVAEVVKLMDQHAFLELAPSEALEVGDLVGLGISHPCTAHDKWQMMPLLDDERRVIDCVRQYF